MKGMFDKCFEDFDRCLKINPANRIAKIQRAFFEFRQFYASLQMYAQATSQSPEQIRQNGEFKAETAKLEKVLNENADVPEALNLYAQILSEQEDYAKAEKYYEIALQKDPTTRASLPSRLWPPSKFRGFLRDFLFDYYSNQGQAFRLAFSFIVKGEICRERLSFLSRRCS
jgi:tetratricopeptide (TPR) repeat protein